MQDKITILMATYNGKPYLNKQIESLIAQTYSNWELWIRDDCSTDETMDLLNKYALQDNRIHIYKDGLKNLGPTLNFATLLSNIDFENYVMFCDQDDVWLPFKIELTLKKMKEKEISSKKPVLIYSPMTKVDNNLNPIPIKNCQYPKTTTINKTIAQNYIYGCTMMLNRKLVELSNPISPKAENHDYWIVLIASLYETVYQVDKSTILYRQHDNNVSGSYRNSSFSARLTRLLDKKYDGLLNKKVQMIDALNRHLLIKCVNNSFLDDYLSHIELGKFKAIYFLYSHRIFKYCTGTGSNILYYISVFNFKRKHK